MPEIPLPISHTVNVLNDKLAAEASQGDGYGIPMSACNHPCERSIWYTLHWASEKRPIEGARASAMQTGNFWEERLIGDLLKIGVRIDKRQGRAMLANGFVRGKIDGLATGLTEAPKAVHVLECKALKADKFRAVVKHGLEKAIPDHFAQCQLYMRSYEIERAAYFCVNKDTDERHIERLHYNSMFAIELEIKLARIVASDEPPPKLHDDPSKKMAFECNFMCDHLEVCHFGKRPRVNCRTCLHGSIDKPELLACALRPDPMRGYRLQQDGCNKHRFNTGLINGQQIDVRGDLVVYEIDGAEWIDGDKENKTPDIPTLVIPPIDDDIPY